MGVAYPATVDILDWRAVQTPPAPALPDGRVGIIMYRLQMSVGRVALLVVAVSLCAVGAMMAMSALTMRRLDAWSASGTARQTEQAIDLALHDFSKRSIAAREIPECYGISSQEFPPPDRIIQYERFGCRVFVIYDVAGRAKLIVPDW